MIKINKYLLLFITIMLLISGISLVSIQKLLPFAKHTTYYCQSVLNTISIPFSHYLGLIPVVLLLLCVGIATVRFLVTILKAQLLKKRLLGMRTTKSGLNGLLKKLQITERTYVITSDARFAFCLGIRNPAIYISTGLISLLTKTELEAVLLHEKYHQMRRDILTMFVASVIESLFPLFPLLSDFIHNFRIEREIKADEAAVMGIGSEKPILSALSKLLTTPSMGAISMAAIADADTLEPRIQRLIKKDTIVVSFSLKHIVISLLSIFILSLVSFSPVQAVEIHQQGQDMMMICPFKGECLNACKQQDAKETKNHSEVLLYSTKK